MPLSCTSRGPLATPRCHATLDIDKGFNSGRFPSDFFQTRYSQKGGEKVKAFAGEAIGVAQVLRLFVELALLPLRLLEPYYLCFLDLCTILDIVMLQDRAVRYVDLLLRTIERHHKAYITLYGVEAAYPKYHFTLHLPEILSTHGVNISAFTTERKHRLVKSIANHVFSNFEHTLVWLFRGAFVRPARGDHPSPKKRWNCDLTFVACVTPMCCCSPGFRRARNSCLIETSR